MRKTVQVLMVALLAIVLSYSCNLVMPERVQISGSPTVDVSAGSVSIDITKYVDLETMLTDSLSGAFSDPGDSFTSNEVPGAVGEPSVYVINARKQLFTQPLADIFDMDTGLGGLTQTIEPMSFKVPTFEVNDSYTDTLDDQSLGVLTVPSLTSIPMVELENVSLTMQVPETGTIEISDFTALVLNAGSLQLDINTTGASSGLSLVITQAVLLAVDDTVISTASNVPLDANSLELLNFDLAGKTLPGQFKFELEISMSNTTNGNDFSLDLDASLLDLAIARAEGVEISELFEGNEPLELVKPADLISATIGTGELLISLAPPVGFSGDLTSFDASLSIGSVLDRPATKESDTLYRIDLAGIELSSFDPGSLEYSINVTAANANIDFPASFVIGTELIITEYSELVLAAADLDFSYSEPFIISQDIIDAVQSATFSDARLVFNLTNGLPSDLIINFASDVLLDVTPASLTFVNGSSATVTQEIPLLAHAGKNITFATDLVETEPGVFGIDVDLALGLTGFNPALGQLTLTNVVPGQNYSFSGNFELVLDLATVTLANVNQTGTFPELGGDPLDFSMLDDIFPAGVLLEGVTTLLELQNPLGGGLELVLLGRYRANLEDPYIYVDLLDPAADPVVIESNFATPNTYTQSPLPIILESGVPVPVYLVDLINTRAANLELAYSVTFTEATLNLITPDAGSIDVFLDIGLPLQLNVTTEGGVYWMPEDDFGDPMLTITDDLLGRTVVGDSEELEQVFDFLESASLSYTLENTVISGDLGFPEVVIYQGAANYDEAIFKKRIPLGGSSSIELDWQDIEYIRNNLFMPTVELFLPEGLININPKGELSLGISLRLETDIVYEFSFGKDDSNDL